MLCATTSDKTWRLDQPSCSYGSNASSRSYGQPSVLLRLSLFYKEHPTILTRNTPGCSSCSCQDFMDDQTTYMSGWNAREGFLLSSSAHQDLSPSKNFGSLTRSLCSIWQPGKNLIAKDAIIASRGDFSTVQDSHVYLAVGRVSTTGKDACSVPVTRVHRCLLDVKSSGLRSAS